MPNRSENAVAFAALRAGTDLPAALALFDTLPAVTEEELLGAWRGGEVPTGHPLDGVLERSGWWGKRFAGPDDVHPLVMGRDPGQRWSLNPALVPIGLFVRHPWLGRLDGAAIVRVLRPLVATRRPRARLRMTTYRGVVSATMCYDALPIHDVFRRVDEATLLAVMDLRGAPPYVFFLEREHP